MAVMMQFSGYGICAQWHVLSQTEGLKSRRTDGPHQRTVDCAQRRVHATRLER